MLIFVYNAKSGFRNKYIDHIHKIVSPDTYLCNLCSLTHNNFTEKKVWRSFRQNSNIEMAFLYKDEFKEKFPGVNEIGFPVILQKENERVHVVLDSFALASLQSTEALIISLNEKILVKNS